MTSCCWRTAFLFLLLDGINGSWAGKGSEKSIDENATSNLAKSELLPNENVKDTSRSLQLMHKVPEISFESTLLNGTQYISVDGEELLSLSSSNLLTCDYGFYKVEGTHAPCSKYQHSAEESTAAQIWCCNCNQGEQWHNWKWTYVQDARKEACVSNIYISSKGWIAVRMLAGVVIGLMAFAIILPMLVTCGDNGPRIGCCVRGQFLFGCRDKTGCWWRTDSRSLIMVAFMPFYVCEALAMIKYVGSMDLNLRPRYDSYSAHLGIASLTITIISVFCMPMAWFCLGVNGQMQGRRHIMRREKNGFTISLFHSWHLHTYYYYCALAAEVALLVIASTWLMSVDLGDPEIRNDDGDRITDVTISPSRDDLFSLVESVFWIHILSFLHVIVGIRVYNDQYFKAKFSGVKLIRRGACFFVDYCVEEPLIQSLDCDYKKFVMDNDGNMTCARDTFADDKAGEDTKGYKEVKGKLISGPTSDGRNA